MMVPTKLASLRITNDRSFQTPAILEATRFILPRDVCSQARILQDVREEALVRTHWHATGFADHISRGLKVHIQHIHASHVHEMLVKGRAELT
jgi:hypothetical protein